MEEETIVIPPFNFMQDQPSYPGPRVFPGGKIRSHAYDMRNKGEPFPNTTTIPDEEVDVNPIIRPSTLLDMMYLRELYVWHRVKSYLDSHPGEGEESIRDYLSNAFGDLPEDVLDGALAIYSDINANNCNSPREYFDDAVDYTKSTFRLDLPFVNVRWVRHPTFKRILTHEGKITHEDWEIEMNGDSEEYLIDLPTSGYIVPTMNGFFRTDTGTPLRTVERAEDALKHFKTYGFDERALMYFECGEYSGDICAVYLADRDVPRRHLTIPMVHAGANPHARLNLGYRPFYRD